MHIVKQARGMEHPVPEEIANAPELMEGLDFYMTAFVELNADRQGRGRIPWTALDAFARRYGVEGDDFDEFVVLLREMDKTFMAHYEEKDNEAKRIAAQQADANAERIRRDALG